MARYWRYQRHSIAAVLLASCLERIQQATYSRPTGLRNKHLWLVRKTLRYDHIVLLEEVRGPSRSLVDGDIGKPRVDVRHLEEVRYLAQDHW